MPEKCYWVCLSIEDNDRTLKSKYSNEIFLESEIIHVWLIMLDCPISDSSNLPLSDWIRCLVLVVCVCYGQNLSLNMKMQCMRQGYGTTKLKFLGHRPQPSWSCPLLWSTPSEWWQRTASGEACPVSGLNSIWLKLQVKQDFCDVK